MSVRRHFWLVKETDKARLLSTNADGSGAVWVPRSVCKSVVKFAEDGRQYRRVEVEVEDWWASKNGMG